MLSLENAVEFNQGLDRWIEDCEDLVIGAKRGLAIEAFQFVVRETAQWTGNLAASWSLSVGAPNAVSETPFKDIDPPISSRNPVESALRKGSPAAVTYALARARADGAASLVNLTNDVFIATGVPYAQAVEENAGSFLRPVNLPAEMVYRAHEMLARKGELTEAAAKALARRVV